MQDDSGCPGRGARGALEGFEHMGQHGHGSVENEVVHFWRLNHWGKWPLVARGEVGLMRASSVTLADGVRGRDCTIDLTTEHRRPRSMWWWYGHGTVIIGGSM